MLAPPANLSDEVIRVAAMDEEKMPIDEVLREELLRHLIRTGYLPFHYGGNPEQFYRALERFHRDQGLEALYSDRQWITLKALNVLRSLPDNIRN
ncbi:hypothetical protein [Hydrogenibacillus sp. N12]|uniref:hypothetical protein n=1 Tax=Hydrogenibacillus sp. N12 TaxID=2866627 RepID=UPI001C7D9203|nr:hypothetical protein [Hydrogenibacillus sp. N12]QZA32415.1 hypothetical protein K2M58_08825 [Hydrogenibacillus sp. N12]